MINVKGWSLDHQTIEKLHSAWIKFGSVPDCFRHYFGMCEVVATLQPVLEIDMGTINLEIIKAKVGVREFLILLILPLKTCSSSELPLSLIR